MKYLPIILLFSFIQSGYSQNKSDSVITILFDVNSSKIMDIENKSLDRAVDLINSKEFYFLKIFGYSDTTGNFKDNLRLSKERTQVVWEYIRERTNIEKGAIYMDWLGESSYDYDIHFDGANYQTNCVDIWVHLTEPDEP